MIIQTPSSPHPRSAAVIAAYRPHAISEAAAVFARQVVAAAVPQSPVRARAFLFAASRLAGFAEQVGLELSVRTLLCEAVIERFILTGTQGFSPATVRTLRANLRALARALERPFPRPLSLPRERVKAPYTPAEIGLLLAAASALSTQSRRMRASALICLGAGAGVIGSELRLIRGADVFGRSGGLVVEVSGRRARAVPVLARFHGPLREAAAFAGGELIIGGRDPQRKNLTSEIAALFTDRSLPRLQAGRLRSTWLQQTAQMIGLSAFMAAAGVSCSQRLGDIAAELPRLSEAQMVALLGGSP
jgi:integrase